MLQQIVLWEHSPDCDWRNRLTKLDLSNTLEQPLLANSSPLASLWQLQINHRLHSHTYMSKKLKGKRDKLCTTKTLYNQSSNDSKRTLFKQCRYAQKSNSSTRHTAEEIPVNSTEYFFTLLKAAAAPFTLSASGVLVKRMNTVMWGFGFLLKNHILKRGYKQKFHCKNASFVLEFYVLHRHHRNTEEKSSFTSV